MKALEPKQRGASGRMIVLAITGDKGSVEVSGDLHIRRLLGGLKSTLFQVTREGQTFVFRGAGFGHGVGMCQLGAIGMAEAGKAHPRDPRALLPRHAPAPSVLNLAAYACE